MVEGRDHHQPVLAHQPVHLLLRLVLRSPDDADLGAEAADFRNLVLRHQPRHADRRDGAFSLGRIGKRPAVISCRGGDNAARTFCRRQREHCVGRPAQLETAGRLMVFELQPNGNAGNVAKRCGLHHRRCENPAGDPPRGRANVLQ
ncbi:hypothetical protein RHECNPAF_2330093 [Rhizobium etli CNPAF512]|nr:hypothetical protein RHECNPAF_2330093 [Rhizobium etli CNPAF512]